MELREGETVGDYVQRLEQRLALLEPPKGFTPQEWYVGQVYTYLLWRDPDVRDGDTEAMKKWSDNLIAYEDRFQEPVKKFSAYMGWDKRDEKPTF
jgi:hypothetical protein